MPSESGPSDNESNSSSASASASARVNSSSAGSAVAREMDFADLCFEFSTVELRPRGERRQRSHQDVSRGVGVSRGRRQDRLCSLRRCQSQNLKLAASGPGHRARGRTPGAGRVQPAAPSTISTHSSDRSWRCRTRSSYSTASTSRRAAATRASSTCCLSGGRGKTSHGRQLARLRRRRRSAARASERHLHRRGTGAPAGHLRRWRALDFDSFLGRPLSRWVRTAAQALAPQRSTRRPGR